MKHLKDILGVLLIFAGVGGVLGGVRGVVGDAWWGGPALGAGAVVNVLAYRVMRSAAPKRTDDPGAEHSDPRV